MASPAGMMICDPGPCDPGALTVVGRDFGLWTLLLFAVTAFVAGRKTSRANLLLPALCMAVIAIAIYSGLAQKTVLLRQSFVSDGLSAVDLRLLDAFRQQTLIQYAIGYLSFALIPFGLGLLMTALQQRKLKQIHASN